MLIPALPFDVVPRVYLVTAVTLLYARTRLFCRLPRNHVEVFHVVAGRCLMALGAARGAGGRVPELRYRPLPSAMTRGAMPPHEPRVCGLALAPVRMATRTVQSGLFGRDVGRAVRRRLTLTSSCLPPTAEPCGELPAGFFRLASGGGARRSQFAEADARQCAVVHGRGTPAPSLVLRVARRALGHVGVKCSRLECEQLLVVGVAEDAARPLDAAAGRMTCHAVVLQKAMSG